MTQTEFDFISEACYEKVAKVLNGIVTDANELQTLKNAKKPQEKEKSKKSENVGQ